MWLTVIRLFSWGNKYISLGGRIVLLNSILNFIPIFHLSFFKLPVLVWKKIVRLQREFLWGGVGGGRKISWVKWDVVCQPKESGGLGVKDIRVMNLSLLAKWRWRLLSGEKALWKEVLVERYGDKVCAKLEGVDGVCPRGVSKWWKDLVNLDKGGVDGWFNDEIDRSVGDGSTTSFWNVAWRGDTPFKVRYNRLFSISTQQEAMVEDMWEDNNSNGRWVFNWRRRLFVWEETLLNDLLGDLSGFVLNGEEDKWRWKLGGEDTFSVKSVYLKLDEDGRVDGNPLEIEKGVFRYIWKAGVPSKVTAFVWKALLDRIPTRTNLEVRHCLPIDIDLNCVWCRSRPECTSHIFLHCNTTMRIWNKLMVWLDLHFIMPPNLFIHWECWSRRDA